jgi:hypothetical protein
MTPPPAAEARERRAEQDIERQLRRMEQLTLDRARELRMSAAQRVAADRAYRKVKRARRLLFFPKHTSTQLRFLRCMIRLTLAAYPALLKRGSQVARYFSDNYGYEWAGNPVTELGRALARDMILRAADSEWGETPLAAAFAYVLFHHEDLELEHPSSYSDVYTRALRLGRDGVLDDLGAEARERLGLAPPNARQPMTPAEPVSNAQGEAG